MSAPRASHVRCSRRAVRSLRAACTGLLLVVFTMGAGGQQPTFRAGVDAIQMDVYVTDENDRPVSGLTQQDFEVFQNGKPQAITTFAPVELADTRVERLPFDAEPDVLTNTNPDGRVLLFILGSTSTEFALRARHQLHKFIDEYFGDNDVAAITSGQGLVTNGQDFTGNRRLLLTAVDKFDGSGPSVRDLPELMEVMARIPGNRKAVIWFTSSVPVDPYDLIDHKGGVRGIGFEAAHTAIATLTRNNIRLFLIDPEGLSSNQLDAVRSSDFRRLAEMTGGFAHVDSNRFDATFERLRRETGSYYLLGFNSQASPQQGRYVKLEVKVRRPGLKVQSRNGYLEKLKSAAPIAPTGDRTPAEQALANPVATTGLPLAVAAAAYRKSGGMATVTMTVEMPGDSLTFTRNGDRYDAAFELRHLATDARNRIYPELRHSQTLSLDEAAHQQVTGRGLRVVSQFDIPQGRYQVRVATASGAARGSVVYDVEVPDFGKGAITLSGVSLATADRADAYTLIPPDWRGGRGRATRCRPPVCTSAGTTIGALRPWSEGAAAMPGFLLRDVLPAPPTTRRDFSAADVVALFAEVYDNDGGPEGQAPYTVTLSADLRTAQGQVVREVTDSRSSRAARRASGGHGFTLQLPLATLQPGTYVLHVSAGSSRSPGDAVSRNIPVRIH